MKKILSLVITACMLLSTNTALYARRAPITNAINGNYDLSTKLGKSLYKPNLDFSAYSKILTITTACGTAEGTYTASSKGAFKFSPAPFKYETCSATDKAQTKSLLSLLKKANKFVKRNNEIIFYSGTKKLFTIKDNALNNKTTNATALGGKYRIISQKENGADVDRMMNETTIEFDVVNNKVGATAGCGSILGDIKVSDKELNTFGLETSKNECAEDLYKLEVAILNNLAAVKTFRKEANHLYLYGANGGLLMMLESK
jgi:heat shock protein HslJ